jgi:hypothetical protein
MLLGSASGTNTAPALTISILSIDTANFVTVSQDPEATWAQAPDIAQNHDAAQNTG